MRKSLNILLKTLLFAMCLIFMTMSLFACNNKNNKEEIESFSLKENYFKLFEGENRTIQIISDNDLKYTFSNSNDEVISVDDKGVVTALKEGASIVTVVSGELSDVLMVEVVANNKYIALTATDTNMIVGATLDIGASVYVKDEISSNIVEWTITEGCDYRVDGNKITLNPTKTGYVTVTAKWQELSAICNIKVVNENSEILDAPNLVIENCNKIKRNTVNGANKYAVLVENSEWVDITENEFDVENFSKNLLNGEKFVVAVKALAYENFDYVDSCMAVITVRHDFESTAIGSAYSCTIAGTIKYTCKNCNISYQLENYLDDHNYIDGKCLDCNKVQSEGVVYAYDAKIDAYYISGVQDSFASDELYALAEYETEQYGKKPVVYVGIKAFYSNTQIRKIVLPTSVIGLHGQCFSLMSNLEHLEIPGVVYTGVDMTYNVDGQTVTYSNTRDNWTDTYNLKTLIVGEGFKNATRNFFIHKWSPASYQPILEVFVKGDYFENLFPGGYPLGYRPNAISGDNYQLTGEVYYYDETGSRCGHWWHYDENGDAVKNEEHTIRENVCVKCGFIFNSELIFKWRPQDNGYEVVRPRLGVDNEKYIVPEYYNDGINGTAPVVSVADGAFSYLKAKTIVLPESVTKLGVASFGTATSLETVVMPGVTTMQINCFINCIKLKRIVIGDQIKFAYQTFHAEASKYSTYIARINAYLVDGADRGLFITSANNNNMLTGNIYYYRENHNAHGTWWKYDANGNIIETYNPHNYVNGVCSCGSIDAKGVRYQFDQSIASYVVVGISDSNMTEVNVVGEYNDGINGLAPVTTVGANAFAYKTNILKVVLHENIKTICDRAFMHADKVQLIDAKGVDTLMGEAHFAYDDQLATLILNDKLSTIPVNTFYDDANDGSINAVDTLTLYLYNKNGAVNNILTLSEKGNQMLAEIYLYNEIKGIHGNNWYYDDKGEIVKYSVPHVLDENNQCECGYIDDKGIRYTFSDGEYVVTGLKDVSVTEVIVLGEYNDGIHGNAKVTSVAPKAFYGHEKAYCKKITKVILHENITTLGHRAFANCDALEIVIAPGVYNLPAEAPNSDGRFQFAYCKSLKSLVLSSELTGVPARVFFDNSEEVTPVIDMLFYEDKTGLHIEPSNELFTGNIYTYNETIGAHGNTWCFDKNGDIVKSVVEHNYDENGECSCGSFLTDGVVYEWDVDTNSYVMSGISDKSLTEITVKGEYNDGLHGKAKVTAVKSKAINMNTTLKRIVLHENITAINSHAFMQCYALEYVDAKGVTTLNGGAHFAYDHNLKVVIFSDALVNIPNNAFFDDTGDNPSIEGDEIAAVDNVSLCLYNEDGANSNIDFDKANNQMLNGIYLYTEKAIAHGKCWSYEDDGEIKITNVDHTFDDNGKCECGAYNTQGVAYAWDETTSTYMVTGLSDTTVTEIFVLGWYDDGVHGEEKVTSVAPKAFYGYEKAYCKNIAKVVLHENVTTLHHRAFGNCDALEVVIAPGVYNLEAENPNSDGRFHFAYCKSLKVVLLSSKLDGVRVRIFFDDTAGLVPQTDLFFMEAKEQLNINESNHMLTGNIYIYNEDENLHGYYWHFNSNGEIVKAAQHSFDATTGKCACGVYDAKGVKYEWDSATNTYVFAGLIDTSLTEINVIGMYNDGFNGEAQVTAVKEKAINMNTKLTKIVLHENIKTINTHAFMQCYALEYVDAKGVTTLNGGAHFAYDHSLKSVIFSDGLTSIPNNSFYDDAGDNPSIVGDEVVAVDNVKLYLYNKNGASSSVTYVKTSNAMLEGIYFYTEENICGNYWYYDNGSIIIPKHDFNDHSKCIRCGEYNTQGVTYAWDETTSTYMATGLSDSSVTEVNVIGWYDDGEGHGEQKVTKVAAKAFSGYYNSTCKNITKVVMHENVTTLEHRVFMNCSELKTVIAPGVYVFNAETPNSDGRFHFANCGVLENVILSSKVSGFAVRVFWHDNKEWVGETDLLFYEKVTLNINANNELLSKDVYLFAENATTAQTVQGKYWYFNDAGEIFKGENPVA